MPKSQITTRKAPAPMGPYSQGLRAGDFVYVSGQGPIDPESGKVKGTTIEEQTACTLDNVKAVLEAAGASMADVVKATCHLADLSHFSRFNAVYERYFPEPRPVRTTVGSQLLGILVEVDVVAYVGPDAGAKPGR
ncbi:MAG TPA: Rid family detoxifying hydrolase [Thermodesulfobacteriota bacterium]